MQLEPIRPSPRTRLERALFWLVVAPLATIGLVVVAGLVYTLGFEHY